MGTGSSKNPDSSSHGSEEREDQGGGQLYVSLKMENSHMLNGELIPHVYGSVPLVGSWEPSKAVSISSLYVILLVFLFIIHLVYYLNLIFVYIFFIAI